MNFRNSRAPREADTCATCAHWRGGCGHPEPTSDRFGSSVEGWRRSQQLDEHQGGAASDLLHPRSSCPGHRRSRRPHAD